MFNTPEEIFYSIIVGVILMLFLAIVFILSIVRYQKRALIYKQERQQLESEFSKILLQSQLEIQEQTLQHISYELHDNLGQVASLIKIHLNTLQLNDQIKAEQKVEEAKELTRQLITDLKLLSVSLNSDRIVQSGLVKGLEIEVDRLNKTGQFESSFYAEGSIPELKSDTTIILYRMVQEAINNAVKHSQATHINITLKVIENLLTLDISDDGVGFNIEEKRKSRGSGMMNLQNRAKLIHADLFIESSPENGTNISIELPI